MKGKVIQFQRGRQSWTPRHFLVQVDGITDRKSAEKLNGKDAEWKSPAGKVILGKVSVAHGNKGLVRVIFEKGLPGQAVTSEVEIK
ncbi:MAG: 50S ribosomal protein L35ae [archaeon]